ncbi:universal stress protein [Streptomyces indicus]|uniref:Nucleotide-binding universal stress protein, UspA family n=1 Tax=Streptomyces indicus TaxID=417292 RepID=A0A1G8V3M2_9ACTN|nr:universal stress protein [Streptomyces indicus]SDJ60726.1 Nucleotide-binding universal stress protein, UspA family [Streptomyces indicus]
MSTHAPVIAAVDGSEHSLVALEWAMEAARTRGAEVLAVQVRGAAPVPVAPTLATLPPVPSPAPVEQDGDPVRDRVEEFLAGRNAAGRHQWRVENLIASRTEGAEDAARTEPDPKVTYTVLDGAPASTVLAERAADAQLLVLGSRGLGGFAALLLGSTGRKLAMQAPCPVVIVPHADRTPDRVETPGRERIVLGLAPDETSDAAVEFAFAEAERRGAELQVVSTYLVPLTSLLVVGELADTSDTPVGQNLREAQTARLAPFRTRYPSVAVDQIATAGDPAGRLVTASTTAALTVVGRHRRRLRPDALLMGSVTNAVLQHAQSPVAVVPGE